MRLMSHRSLTTILLFAWLLLLTASVSASPRNPAAKNTKRTVIAGHGVVLLPGNAPYEAGEGGEQQEARVIPIVGGTYRVVGTGDDLTVDGVPIEEVDSVPVEEGDGALGPMRPGKAAAIAFAEKAEEILKGQGGR